MGQSAFGDVCDASLPQTSQKWYQLCQALFSGFETLAILLFIYIHRKSKYLHQTIPRSPFNNDNINDYDYNPNYDDIVPDIDDDDGNIIREEIILQPVQPPKILNRRSLEFGYQSPKIMNESPLSKSFDSCDNIKLANFTLEDRDNNNNDMGMDIIYDNDNDSDNEYYNESQNRYFKMGYNDTYDLDNNKSKSSKKMRLNIGKHKHSMSSSSSPHNNMHKHKNKERRETLTIIESNTDTYRIFCILLPIYYRFLGILCVYCMYRMTYMFILYSGVGLIVEIEKNPFNNEYEYSNVNNITAIFFLVYLNVLNQH
eukprot:510628_1